MVVLTLLILDKITCIELYTRAVRRNFHSNPGFLTVRTGNGTDITLGIIVSYIVMIITTRKLQLLKSASISLPIGFATLKSIGVPATGAYSPVGMD